MNDMDKSSHPTAYDALADFVIEMGGRILREQADRQALTDESRDDGSPAATSSLHAGRSRPAPKNPYMHARPTSCTRPAKQQRP